MYQTPSTVEEALRMTSSHWAVSEQENRRTDDPGVATYASKLLKALAEVLDQRVKLSKHVILILKREVLTGRQIYQMNDTNHNAC